MLVPLVASRLNGRMAALIQPGELNACKGHSLNFQQPFSFGRKVVRHSSGRDGIEYSFEGTNIKETDVQSKNSPV